MFYRLINTKTNKAMALSYNATTIEEVREDIVTFISLDEEVVGLTEPELAAKIEAAPIRVEQSEVMFEPYEKATIEEYLVLAEPEAKRYIPSGRIAHVSNYMS